MQIDRMYIGALDVWLELGRASKHSRKGKCVIKRWRLVDVSKSAVMGFTRDAVEGV